jgi:mono/diheme cytochrome c family protein
LFVNNFLGRSVTVHDVAQVLTSESAAATRLQVVSTVAQETMSAAALRGKQLFYNAADRRMSRDNYMSCASCHADGGDDGMVWDFTQRGEGLRRTISLLGRAGTGHGSVHWSANFNEIQDFENDIRGAFGGTGFMSNEDFAATADPLGAPKAGKSAALDDLAAYLQSLTRVPRSPVRNADGTLTASALRGQQLFASAQCATCHSGTTLQDGLRHDVGTIQASSGKGNNQPLAGVGFDTPTLAGVWTNSSYFHHGQAASVASTFTSSHGNAGSLSAADVTALSDYVRSLDGTAPPPVVRISSNLNNLCVNIRGASTASGAAVIQWACGNAANEKFTVTAVDGHMQFAARHSGLCIAQSNTSTSGGPVVQVACNSGATAQWLQNGSTLRNRATGTCLDVPGGTSTPDTQLITWACNGGNNQNWTQTGVSP